MRPPPSKPGPGAGGGGAGGGMRTMLLLVVASFGWIGLLFTLQRCGGAGSLLQPTQLLRAGNATAVAGAAAPGAAAAAAAPPACPTLPLNCSAFHIYAGVTPRANADGTTTFVWDPTFIAPYWRTGNRMSAYWNARAMTAYAGAAFEAGQRVGQIYNTTWMQYLPQRAAAPRCPDVHKYLEGCFGCAWGRGPYESFQYPHICEGAWVTFRPTVQREMSEALTKWAAASNTKLREFQPDDTVIQFRCAHDTIVHAEYGPLAYSCYNVIPNATRNIFILADPQRNSHPVCVEMLADLQRYLQSRFAGAAVSLLELGVEESFIAMWRAPILIKNSQSSYGLWAGFAGSQTVWSPPMIEYLVTNTTPNYGPGWNWLKCPVLYPSVANKNGVSMGSGPSVVGWLQKN